MAKSFRISNEQWRKLKAHLVTIHGPTVFMLRDRCRRDLGFTVRTTVRTSSSSVNYYSYSYQDDYWLDFYDDLQQTMFLMQYGEFISSKTEEA